jgi:threonine/homoserine/homoserine lactone efflux protein
MLGVESDRWIAFTIAEAAVSLTPGPAVALVVGHGIARGTRMAVYAALGILSANAIYFALSAAGLGAVIASHPLVFETLEWIGVTYLAWLGIAAWTGHASPLQIPSGGDLDRSEPGGQRARLGAWTAGLTLQLANPKLLLSFFAVLPPFITPGAPIAPQMLVFGVSSIVPEFFILTGFGWFGARAAPWLARPGYALLTERVAGSILLLTAIGIAASRWLR